MNIKSLGLFAIAVCITLLPTILSKVFDYIHDDLMWRRQHDRAYWDGIIDDYICATADYISHSSEANMSKYMVSQALVVRYAESKSLELIEHIDNEISNRKKAEAYAHLMQFAQLNRHEIKKHCYLGAR